MFHSFFKSKKFKDWFLYFKRLDTWREYKTDWISIIRIDWQSPIWDITDLERVYIIKEYIYISNLEKQWK